MKSEQIIGNVQHFDNKAIKKQSISICNYLKINLHADFFA